MSRAPRVDDPRGCCRCDAPPPNYRCPGCGEIVCADCMGTADVCTECVYTPAQIDAAEAEGITLDTSKAIEARRSSSLEYHTRADIMAELERNIATIVEAELPRRARFDEVGVEQVAKAIERVIEPFMPEPVVIPHPSPTPDELRFRVEFYSPIGSASRTRDMLSDMYLLPPDLLEGTSPGGLNTGELEAGAQGDEGTAGVFEGDHATPSADGGET